MKILPCVSGGQGRWTRSVTNLTRYMSPWHFWPKWEMGRLRTFKRLGAHTHRELKSPRDLQKARGGRSDPRASYPNPATSGRGGKIKADSLVERIICFLLCPLCSHGDRNSSWDCWWCDGFVELQSRQLFCTTAECDRNKSSRSLDTEIDKRGSGARTCETWWG